MTIRTDLGKIGEEKAVVYLKRNGYSIVARNVRNRFGEIDIVAREDGVICFIEVRTRRGPDKRAEALESVDSLKRRRLSRLAACYLKNNNLWGRKARFDVVAVSLAETSSDIHLVKDAFPIIEKYS